LSVLQGSCYVQTARNELVKAFLDSDCDSIFFLDDDISWHREDALKFLEMDDDIVAGVYPYKTKEEGYPVVIHTYDDGRPVIRRDGCIKGALVPGGFIRIKRQAIEKMVEAYPALKYSKPVDFDAVELVDLFPQGVKNGRWVGEDYAFCELWTALGGEIIVVPDIDFIHHGEVTNPEGLPVMTEFKGNYHRFLLRQPGGSEYVEGSDSYPGNEISGWLTVPEQQFLFEHSSKCDSVLEVGSFMGRSAAVLLSGKADKVYCVDNWTPYVHLPDDTEEMAENRYRQFIENIKPYADGNGRPTVIRADSADAAKQFPDKSLDMVFIDADHSEAGIRSDIEAWLPKTKKLICGHDFTYYWPDVKKVVMEKFGHKVKTVDAIWYVDLEG